MLRLQYVGSSHIAWNSRQSFNSFFHSSHHNLHSSFFRARLSEQHKCHYARLFDSSGLTSLYDSSISAPPLSIFCLQLCQKDMLYKNHFVSSIQIAKNVTMLFLWLVLQGTQAGLQHHMSFFNLNVKFLRNIFVILKIFNK